MASENFEYVIKSSRDQLPIIESTIGKISKKIGLTEEQSDNFAIAVTEAIGNSIVHGNKENPQKKVILKISIKTNKIEVSVQDEGNGFDPDTISDPLHPENIMKESGRGLFILKSLMDSVKYSHGGTMIHFTMKINTN